MPEGHSFIMFGYAGWGLRFAQIWGQISNAHISKTVRGNPIIMLHFFD